MPIYLRKFYFKQLLDAKTKEKEDMEKAQKSAKKTSPGVIPKFKR